MLNKKLRYNLGIIKKKSWKIIEEWKKKIIQRVLLPLFFRNNDGIYILEEEWDNLIILDACRFDSFKKEIKNWQIEGRLEYRISRATNTPLFLIENFRDKRFESKCKNIVYVTANPYVNTHLKGKFYKIIPVWDFGWDEKLRTVPPSPVYETALEAVEKYQGKQFIIHFMQPHYPFIKLKISDTSFIRLREKALSGTSKTSGVNVWDLLAKGKISISKVISGYMENLRIAMPYVEKLCNTLPGKTIITSDHGEAFGEKIHPLIPLRIYGHPYGQIRIESLVKVPWFICKEAGSLKKVKKELIKIKVKRLKTKMKLKQYLAALNRLEEK